MENAKRRLRVAFEFFTKLGVPYWTFHDRYDNHGFKIFLQIIEKLFIKYTKNICEINIKSPVT
jgi:xylose isomerase